jgi:hypothetical protein
MDKVSSFFENSEVNFDMVKNIFQQPQPQSYSEELAQSMQMGFTKVGTAVAGSC